MLRKIFTIAITIAAGMLIVALLWPTRTNEVVTDVLGEWTGIKNATPVVQKISNAIPESVKTAVKEAVSKPSTPATPAETATNASMSNAAIFAATNKERVKTGLAPLTINAKLSASAKIKTEDMVTKQYFEHTSPSGKTVSDLGNQVGYNFVVMGENLALGDFASADDLLQAWMNSPGHRANILNAKYQELGVYAERGMYQGREVWFAVQHFGTARGVCPVVETKLRQTIESTNTSLTQMQGEIEALRQKIDASDSSDPNYKTMVDQFNTLVNTYNQTLATSQQQIQTYNAEVKAFNSCLTKYQ